jgi:hypothetical protein
MTLLSELIEIPEQVHKSDFVISLATAIDEPERTVADYVVTPQLAGCFDRAISLVATSLTDSRSKSTYLHASFGAGKTAMMSVLHLLLQGDPVARSIPELAPVVARYADRIDGRRFLLVPYHFVGRSSMEQEVLGGYVEHMRRLHPEAPLPAVYVADGILEDARTKRTELGDDVFFRVLSEGAAADEWGDYGADWDPARFEAALIAPPGSSERDQLVGALVRTHYRALPGQAQATAEGFVPLDAGLDAISRHAKGLGYDAVVLFLDELVLWLASRMGDAAFVSREGAKVVKLVEADAGERPAPIVSFIARQRDLRELVGENMPGAQSLTAIDILRHSEGRFDTITLEDRNLPAIAAKRLLRPRSEQARQQLDDVFGQVRRQLEERDERDVLLTDTGDLDAFRRLYPFSPALVDALVALSGAMQRERTALKVMLQLLVEGRDHLQTGQLIPLGDLWDAINAGDEPLTEVMRAQFGQARRLWDRRFLPMLLRDQGLIDDQVVGLPPEHPFVTDARLIKSLLIAALVPEVGPLRNLTVSRLTALNAGIVRAFIPGTERQQVLDRLRRWAAEAGELRVGDDEHDPTVTLVLTGIDTSPILEAARVVDTDGERRRRVRDLLSEALQVKEASSLDPWLEVTWRGTRRKVTVTFGNVRDATELPDEMLRAGTDPRMVIDFPWDVEDYGPTDDRSRVADFRRERDPEWTAIWLPNFLTDATAKKLGDLVRLDYILSGDTFDRLASHLSPNDRPAARTQLANQQSAVREQVMAALRQAYGVDPAQRGVTEERLSLGDQFLSLDPGLPLQPPVGTSLRAAAEGVADQLFRHRFPKHPEFPELVSRSELTHTLGQLTAALGQPNGRLENVEAPLRRVLTKVAGPLDLGTMYQAHFVADVSRWVDLVERRRARAGAGAVTVGQVRRWLDGADTPAERRGLSLEVSDLVILCVATATNRAVVTAGQAVTRPELGRVRDDWELRAQDLPSPAVWDEALRRANEMGVVATSTLLAAASVADLTQKLQAEYGGQRVQGVRDLVPALEAAFARLGVDSASPRLRSARAAMELVEELRRRPDHAADVLAGIDLPTTPAALGTSIGQSAVVADELARTNWDLLRAVADLDAPWAEDAAAITGRLAEALAADELTTALRARLQDAARAATELLARATRSSNPAPAPAPDPAFSQATAAGQTTPTACFDRATAEIQLREIRRRLRAEENLDLVWSFEDPAADGQG